MTDLHAATERSQFEAWLDARRAAAPLQSPTLFEAWCAALSAPAVPPGYVLVPVEPTLEMLGRAMKDCAGIGSGSCGEHSGVDWDDMRSVYEAMLSAAPSAKEPQE